MTAFACAPDERRRSDTALLRAQPVVERQNLLWDIGKNGFPLSAVALEVGIDLDFDPRDLVAEFLRPR